VSDRDVFWDLLRLAYSGGEDRTQSEAKETGTIQAVPERLRAELGSKLVSFKKPTGKTFAMHSRLDNLSDTLG
jgi:hypothetical protein